MLLGLFTSAMIGNADRGMPLMVLMIMGQLVFSGGLFAVHGHGGARTAGLAGAVPLGVRDDPR